MSRRLYLGRLPADTRSEDINKLFEGQGRIIDCRVMTGFGFVEFEEAKDAEEAANNFNGKPFMGSTIVVEFAKESRPRRDPYEGGGRDSGAARSRRPPGIRIIVSGLSRDTSWQDLKDFGRDAGPVSFSDIQRDPQGTGILEYLSREDANRAVRDLDGKDLRGRNVRVTFDDSRAGPDNYRRDDRRDSYRDSRSYRDDRSRGGRSRSPPPRRDYEDRRARSPPPPRREAEDRRPTGYDDYRRDDYSRGGHNDRRDPDYYDRRREEPERRRDDYDRRRDDRRRDERDERFEERPPRTNGDAYAR